MKVWHFAIYFVFKFMVYFQQNKFLTGIRTPVLEGWCIGRFWFPPITLI